MNAENVQCPECFGDGVKCFTEGPDSPDDYRKCAVCEGRGIMNMTEDFRLQLAKEVFLKLMDRIPFPEPEGSFTKEYVDDYWKVLARETAEAVTEFMRLDGCGIAVGVGDKK